MVCSHQSPECRCTWYYQGFRAVYVAAEGCWGVFLGLQRMDSAPSRADAIGMIRGA